MKDEEYYGLNFVGKASAIEESVKPPLTTISPYEEHNCKDDNKESLNSYYIGDNLEVLKHLKKDYTNKIKCIYIDPPYNTGKQFIYNDKFKSSKGDKHSSWLSFMYPRLVLARELLSDDGVIFISIDDNECSNLKLICDEIFGEKNYVGCFARKTKTTTNDSKTGVNKQHDNNLVYSKNIDIISLRGGGGKDLTRYKNLDNDDNGPWISDNPSILRDSRNKYFIKNPITGKKDYPPLGRSWAFSKEDLEDFIKSGKVIFKEKHKENERGFIIKRYLKDLKSLKRTFDSLVFISNDYMNQSGIKDLKSLEMVGTFQHPKPVNFIIKILEHITISDSIILDFFAGSSTTAHATMLLNSKDCGKRKYIMVQSPEEIKESTIAFKEGYRTIDEIGRERILRAAKKIKESSKADIDYGYKVYYCK